MNANCTICFDYFDGKDITATHCGHVFHAQCISQWVDISEFCPECRTTISRNNLIKLFLNINSNGTLPPAATLKNNIDSIEIELKSKNAELARAETDMKEFQEYCENAAHQCRTLCRNFSSLEEELECSKKRERLETIKASKQYTHLYTKIQKLNQTNKNLQTHLNELQYINYLLQCSQQEMEQILCEQGVDFPREVGHKTAEKIAKLCVILKREVFALRNSKNLLIHELEIKNRRLKKLLKKKLKKLQQIANNHPVTSNNTKSEDAYKVTSIAACKDENERRSIGQL